MYTSSPIGSIDPIEDAAWRSAADALAAQFRVLYVNRTDKFGGYKRLRPVGCKAGWFSPEVIVSPTTLPHGKHTNTFDDRLPWHIRRAGWLHTDVIREFHEKHGGMFDVRVLATIGVHLINNADDTCKFVRIDLDAHGTNATPETATRNMAAALAWVAKLRAAGFDPLLWDSDGRGGLWIEVFFASPIPATTAHLFGLWIVADWTSYGMTDRPEVLPKQTSVRHTAEGCGGYGRLPGMHHKRNVWSRLWSGTGWLAGADAVSRFLAVKADSPTLIPKDVQLEAEILLAPAPVPVPRPRPKRDRQEETSDAEIGVRSLLGYIRAIGPKSDGTRSDPAYDIGDVARANGVPYDVAFQCAREWNATNVPPLPDLESHFKNGYTNGKRPKRVHVPRETKQRKASLPLPSSPPKRKDPARASSSKGVSETPTPTPGSDSSSSSLPLEELARAADSSEDTRPLCRNGRPLLVEGVGRHEGNNKVIRPSCNRWSCPECNNRMRENRKTELVPAVMRCESPVAVWEGEPKAFQALREHLKRLTGDKPRVCTVKLDEERMFAVFLDAPDSPRITRTEPAVAARLLTTALDLFLVVQGSKAHPFRPINVSKNFLPPDKPPRAPQQWRRVGPTKLSLDEIVKLLTDRGVFANATDFESVYPIAGGRPVSLITWSYPAGMPLEEQADINRAIVTGVIDRERPFQLSDLDDVAERLLAAAVRREAAPSRAYVVEVASPPPSLSRVEERGAGVPLPADVIRWRYADEGAWRTPKA